MFNLGGGAIPFLHVFWILFWRQILQGMFCMCIFSVILVCMYFLFSSLFKFIISLSGGFMAAPSHTQGLRVQSYICWQCAAPTLSDTEISLISLPGSRQIGSGPGFEAVMLSFPTAHLCLFPWLYALGPQLCISCRSLSKMFLFMLLLSVSVYVYVSLSRCVFVGL